MKTKSLKELYELVLNKFSSDPTDLGICISAYHLSFTSVITREEKDLFIDDLFSRRPKWYTSTFWWSIHHAPGKAYWWKKTPDGRRCRIKFLKHIIKKLK
jgi:hypothetical protein